MCRKKQRTRELQRKNFQLSTTFLVYYYGLLLLYNCNDLIDNDLSTKVGFEASGK